MNSANIRGLKIVLNFINLFNIQKEMPAITSDVKLLVIENFHEKKNMLICLLSKRKTKQLSYFLPLWNFLNNRLGIILWRV